jgi:hypothetical protein
MMMMMMMMMMMNMKSKIYTITIQAYLNVQKKDFVNQNSFPYAERS